MNGSFDPKPILDGLKDFQRKTVAYVFDKLYGPRQTKRFLVADEVGLGKTLVARGVIAKAIEHLQGDGIDHTDRIDVVYVCSNADIARQNINRLNVTGKEEFNLPTRLTLLPLHLRRLKSHGINFVSFTPGTAFDLKSRGGLAEERALLYRLLQYAWGKRGLGHVGVFHVLRAGAGLDGFRNRVKWTPDRVGSEEGTIDKDLADAFRDELIRDADKCRAAGQPTLREQFIDLAERSRRPRSQDWNERFAIVGELRTVLARSCVRALEPDLVILDEFQRFRDLLDGDSDAAQLARFLFDEPTARVLLLSATPYKMYTLADERDEDHYADFLRTARFLMGTKDAATFAGELRTFRHAILDADGADPSRVVAAKRRVERRLRRVMVRTERLGVTEDRNGMLADGVSTDLRLEPADLRAYLSADRVSQYLGAGDMLEYWKSGSYLLNFMESYKLKKQFRLAYADAGRRRELQGLLQDADGLLSASAIKRYARVDPGNARLRALMSDVIDNDAWRLLWLPPSMPDYGLRGVFADPRLAGFTKRLVFSSWSMVPQVIATLVSYEAERQMMRTRSPGFLNTTEARKRNRPLLRFGRADGRLTGMSLLSLLYPSPALARIGDPHVLGRALDGASGAPALDEVLARAERSIAEAIRPIVRDRRTDGPVDESWYWATPLLLDEREDAVGTAAWLGRRGLADRWASGVPGEDAEDTLWADHLEEARRILADPSELGRVPDDLSAVLASVAVGSPANCALRAFARVAPGQRGFAEEANRDGAARVAWGLRSLFNVPEVMALVRGQGSDELPYWTKVIGYCLDGGLGAVLAEYAHVLREALGHLDRDPGKVVAPMAAAMFEALSIRAANYTADDIRVEGGDLMLEPWRLRARYALRFGTQSTEDQAELQRAGAVRTAFNSPFWPFVLATTSVGQEGLDFHQYCHAVVHWNLPGNPVDLEQREGRVHRYKGHAIRKNVARAHRADGYRSAAGDPWEAMFVAARKARPRGVNDLVPFWVYQVEGGARIERYVPTFPLSREVEKLRLLKRSLAAYRLVFGQPRQEDLAQFVMQARASGQLAETMDLLMLDLSPR
jgi:hypothetical protein